MRICTTNPGKLAEFAGMLTPLGINLLSASIDFPETKETFKGNAVEKAINYSTEFPGEWIIASTLECLTKMFGDLADRQKTLLRNGLFFAICSKM